MIKNIKIPLFLLYFIFLFPLVLSIILGGTSSSRIISGSLSIRNYGEIIAMTIAVFYILVNINFFYNHYVNNKYLKPFFWLSFIYIVSTIWSEFRLLTFFRATEFLIIGLLSLLVYNQLTTIDNKLSYKGLRRYLLHIAIIGILNVFLKYFAFGEIVIKQNFLADNALSLLFAGCVLICFYQNFMLKEKNKLVFFLLFSFLFFSYSLTAIVTILVCVLYLYLSRFNNNTKYFFFIFVVITSIVFFAITEIKFINQIFSYISFRSIERIETLTGRENIWGLILEELDGKILGSGFATDQQLLVNRYLKISHLFEINVISSGHNTYLESYIAAKWLGVILVIYSFYFWFKKANICFPKEHASLVESLILFAIISGFTTSGYGGSMVSHPYILFWVTFTPLIVSNNNEKK